MKEFEKEIHLTSFEALSLNIFVIGYKKMGESIVLLFKDERQSDSNVVFSIVIDCYKTEKNDVVDKILTDNGVSKIDLLFWTHPHDDHTRGIGELIKKYFDPEMVVFLPYFCYDNLDPCLLKSESSLSQKAYQVIEKMSKQAKNEDDFIFHTFGRGDSTHSYSIKISSFEEPLVSKMCTLYMLTPHINRIMKYTNKGNIFSNPNELSISFIMSLDGYDFYFGGDAVDLHLQKIRTNLIQGVRWIKVPHHCSLGSRVVADNIGPQFDFAASTVYAPSNLPNEDIQKIYGQKGPLHMTQMSEEIEDCDYGIVHYIYHFNVNGNNAVKIFTYGNAGKYSEKDGF